jgi:hypothetical protein
MAVAPRHSAPVSARKKTSEPGATCLDLTCAGAQSDAMKRYWLAASILSASVAAHPLVAMAVDCGDVLVGPASVRLDRDLSCAGATALTVRDGATLNLGRHSLTCLAGGTGVAVEGEGARVAGGVVTGCDVGVAVEGDGHLVYDVRARFNGLGFRADGGVEGLRLRDNSAEFNHAAGFQVEGDGNTIASNAASGNGDAAIVVRGDDNLLSRNRTNGNCLTVGCAGAYVVGGSGNRVIRNTATGEETGIVLTRGTSGSVVMRNRIRYGLARGILVEQGAEGNVLRGNMVRTVGADLVDANGTCVANDWRGNAFHTRTPACLE